MMQSWDIFCAMQTQWRCSGGGAYGFDYNVLPMLLRFTRLRIARCQNNTQA
ncbi:UNVERIFIED_ASMBLY: hypothetical protein SD1_14 [Shigella phage 2019SD1]|uniref:Uncharacterized protein n=1 Tax=Shigella phage 2019SD1 TaxID=2848074 RepID=A0A6M5CAM8_9CAUD|nr:tail length tape measure protein [Shigella phage 2019SD1]